MTRQSIATEAAPFVEDMHLFCDRWCTRCGMAAKCRMAMAWPGARFEPVQTTDAAAGLFQFLQIQFQKSARLWDARAGLCGDDAGAQGNTGPRRSHEHPLFLDAQCYATLVNEWFHAEEPWFDGRHKALEVHELAGLPNASFAEAMLEIRSASESIGWYLRQVSSRHALGPVEIKLRMVMELDDRPPPTST